MSATEFRYDFVVDQTHDNNTHNMTLDAVGRGHRVLDVGCSTGYLSDFLARERQCEVIGLEPDADAAAAARQVLGDRVLTGGTELLPCFPPASFDVVLFADVLEHLTDPGEALREARRVLAPGGRLVASIPNCAHGDVRLLLLAGHFPYQRTGLLDSTHVRFLTRHSIPPMLQRSGFSLTSMVAKTVPLGGTEFAVNLDYFGPEVVAAVRQDPHHVDYQYVLTAVPDAGEGHRFGARHGWAATSLVETWAGAFSPAEGASLVLPVAGDDSAVQAAVTVIERQCLAAGTTLERVADIELVRTDAELDLTGCTVVGPDWDRARLRATVLPALDSFVV